MCHRISEKSVNVYFICTYLNGWFTGGFIYEQSSSLGLSRNCLTNFNGSPLARCGWLVGWLSQPRRNTCPPTIQSHNCNCATFEDVAFVQPNKSINLRRLCHGLLNYRLTVPKSWPSTTTGFDTGVWSAHRSAGIRKTTTTAAAPSERDEPGIISVI